MCYNLNYEAIRKNITVDEEEKVDELSERIQKMRDKLYEFILLIIISAPSSGQHGTNIKKTSEKKKKFDDTPPKFTRGTTQRVSCLEAAERAVKELKKGMTPSKVMRGFHYQRHILMEMNSTT